MAVGRLLPLALVLLEVAPADELLPERPAGVAHDRVVEGHDALAARLGEGLQVPARVVPRVLHRHVVEDDHVVLRRDVARERLAHGRGVVPPPLGASLEDGVEARRVLVPAGDDEQPQRVGPRRLPSRVGGQRDRAGRRPLRPAQEGRAEGRVLHRRDLVAEGGEIGAAPAELVDPQDRLVASRAPGGGIAVRGREHVGRGQDAHAVVELVRRDEALLEPARHRVLAVEHLHLERVARAVELLLGRRGPVAAHHLRVLGPRRLDDAGLDVVVGEDVEAGEAVGGAVYGHESLPGAHERDERRLGLGREARATVVGDDHVVRRERAGGDPVRLLHDAHVEPAAVDEELAQQRRRRAPVVVVAAREDEGPQLGVLEEAGPDVRPRSLSGRRAGPEDRQGQQARRGQGESRLRFHEPVPPGRGPAVRGRCRPELVTAAAARQRQRSGREAGAGV